MNMNKASGFLLSEIITAIIAIAICLAFGVGIYIDNERDKMVERAKASFAAIRTRVAAASESEQQIRCDNSLADQSELTNDFIPLTIKPFPIDKADPEKGYRASIYIHSKKNVDRDDTFITAERLYKDIKKNDKDMLRAKIKEDDEIEYFVLMSTAPVCLDPMQTSPTPTPAPTRQSARTSNETENMAGHRA